MRGHMGHGSPAMRTDSMIAEVLQSLVDRGETTVRELSEVAGYARTSGYEWLSGNTAIPSAAIQSWIARHPSKEVQQAVASAISGNRAVILDLDEDDLDYDHNGVVDLEDAASHAIEVMRHAIGVIERVNACRREGRVNTSDLIDAASVCGRTQRALQAARLILTNQERHTAKRRKCRNIQFPKEAL